MEREFSYAGTAYRQSASEDAPWLVAFVASAEELLAWAGIPSRTAGSEMGFQRVEDEMRVQRTKEFFDLPPNQSPTAIIVGIHPAFNSAGESPPLNDQTRAVRLELGGSEGPIRPCKLLVKVAERAPGDAAETLRVQLLSRLAANANAGGSEPTVDAGSSDEDDLDENGGPTNEGDDEDNDADEVELASSVMERLVAHLSDSDWIDTNRDAILDLAKPATIIDGQHRLRGASLCERGIPFIVCALFDCDWKEQVFQFTVVNYTQKGIPDQFITANAALSLTNGELNGIAESTRPGSRQGGRVRIDEGCRVR